MDETEPKLKETKAGYESNKLEEEDETLENIIKAVNQEYPGIVSDENKVILRELASVIDEGNKQLEVSAKTNDFNMFLDNFQFFFEEMMMEQYNKTIESHDKKMKAYEKVFKDNALYQAIKIVLAKATYKKYRN